MHALLIACGLMLADAAEVNIAQQDADPTQVSISVPWPAALASDGLAPQQASQWLSLHVVDPQGMAGLAMLAQYTSDAGRLVLTPRYPLLPGHTYRVRWRAGDRVLERDHQVPPLEAEPGPEVVAVYPNHPQLPANLLRFYLEFSRPMREGRETFERIELLDDTGKPVPDPWRPVELWSADGRRLTLYLHPGRIKRGVNLREEIGPLMTPGRQYTLVARAALSDTEGRPLGRDFVHRFTTTDEDRRCPSVTDWQLVPPASGSREPLVVRFGEPLDRHLAARCLHVADSAGSGVPGAVEVAADGTGWRFTPYTDWTSKSYTVQVDDFLEDLAGNTPVRPFEVDVQGPAEGNTPQRTIEFRPR